MQIRSSAALEAGLGSRAVRQSPRKEDLKDAPAAGLPGLCRGREKVAPTLRVREQPLALFSPTPKPPPTQRRLGGWPSEAGGETVSWRRRVGGGGEAEASRLGAPSDVLYRAPAVAVGAAAAFRCHVGRGSWHTPAQ